MRFVIIGAGRVGLCIVRILHEEDHDIILVELDRDRVEWAREANLEVSEGDGSREEVLADADIETADVLGALTIDLNVNFTTCTIGKHFGHQTALRVNKDYREAVCQEYTKEIDEAVYPKRLGAIGAESVLLGSSVRAIADIA